MSVRIVGIGQRAGGDDGAGPAVIDRLRKQGVREPIELFELPEPSALLPLLENVRRVIVVDAALGAGAPGTVIEVRPDEIDTCAISSVSTHGMSVGQTIALARVLTPETVCPDIHIVAIAAERPVGIQMGLSPEVTRAIERAAMVARSLAEQP